MNYKEVILIAAFFGVAFGPMLGIWVVNALFPAAAIPITFKTWFASLMLIGLIVR